MRCCFCGKYHLIEEQSALAYGMRYDTVNGKSTEHTRRGFRSRPAPTKDDRKSLWRKSREHRPTRRGK